MATVAGDIHDIEKHSLMVLKSHVSRHDLVKTFHSRELEEAKKRSSNCGVAPDDYYNARWKGL